MQRVCVNGTRSQSVRRDENSNQSSIQQKNDFITLAPQHFAATNVTYRDLIYQVDDALRKSRLDSYL